MDLRLAHAPERRRELVAGLAKSASSTDAQTIVVELKPNIKFSDGTPLDSEAVKSSIERTIAAKNVGSVRAELNEVESHHRRQPDQVHHQAEDPDPGQFYNLLSQGETFVVSPTAVASGTSLDEKPVGAGPFLLDSYTPEDKAVFKRNPNYFEKDKIKLSGIELIQTTQAGIDPQATVNALLDGIRQRRDVGQPVPRPRGPHSRPPAEDHVKPATDAILGRPVQEQAAVRQPEGAAGAELRGRPRRDQRTALPGHKRAAGRNWTSEQNTSIRS